MVCSFLKIVMSLFVSLAYLFLFHGLLWGRNIDLMLFFHYANAFTFLWFLFLYFLWSYHFNCMSRNVRGGILTLINMRLHCNTVAWHTVDSSYCAFVHRKYLYTWQWTNISIFLKPSETAERQVECLCCVCALGFHASLEDFCERLLLAATYRHATCILWS